jgi:hypothetical protein
MPLESVPKKFCKEGERSLGKVPHIVGSSGAKKERSEKNRRTNRIVKLNLKR